MRVRPWAAHAGPVLPTVVSRADVVVCRGTGGAGGRWRRELRLDAAESETEGVVDVSAQVGEIGMASVRVHRPSVTRFQKEMQ